MSVAISLLVMGQAIVGGQGQSSAGDLSGFYNPRREIKFTGVVKSKAKGQAPGYAEGISLLVQTGKTIREVELGPTWFVGRQQASVNLGEKITVTGVPIVLDRRQKVVVARQIMRGKQVLALRDGSGMPYWSARRTTRTAMSSGNGAAQRMDTMYQGTIGGMKTFMMNGEEYSGYSVNTNNGPLDVAVAPSWYWNNQGSTVNIGDTVTLYGSGQSTRIGGVTLVNSFNYPGGTYILRSPGGFNPVYGGFQGGIVNGMYRGG